MNTKSILIAVVLCLTVALAVPAQDRAVREIVSEIKQDQDVERAEAIDPDRVSEDTLEELGEALMSVMVPNERQHEYMERMMGGEGSESLEAMHRSMGYSYLAGGGRGTWDPGSMGLRWGGGLGSGMLAPGGSWGPSMMDGPGAWRGMHGWGAGGWIWVLVALLAIAVIVLVALLVARSRGSSPGGRTRGGAREILAERYARGEISREEYRRALDDIG